jgi:hypothetical protein
MSALRTLAVACVAGWLGVMAFFSFVAAPGIFRAIDRRVAGEAVAALLPAYYRWGVLLSAVALAALLVVAAGARAGRRRHLVAAVLAGVMVGVLVWALAVMLPVAEAARRARDDQRFALAHRAAVRLNVLVMVCAAGVLVLQAVTPVGRRGG